VHGLGGELDALGLLVLAVGHRGHGTRRRPCGKAADACAPIR
jgi:hypothetical protein